MDMRTESIRVYLSTAHPCPYLPGRTATSLIIDPELETDHYRMTQLTLNGFRRSGDLIYRPHCTHCRACVSVRIPVREFQPNRAHRRIVKKNSDLAISTLHPVFKPEHFELYIRYQQARHPGSDMCDRDPDKYKHFLITNSGATEFIEFVLDGRLIAVSVTDALIDGLSAVYTFFDPEFSRRSLGTFAILWQIESVRLRGLDWLYLGYWIEECDKMSYKTNFRPIEGFKNGNWSRLAHI